MTEKDGKPGLLVSVQEKSYSPPIVRPLINIDGTNYNEVLFSAGARITFLDFGTFGSELRNDVIVGSIYRFAIGVLSPVLTQHRGFSSLRRSPSTPTNFISTMTTTSTRSTESASLAERSMLDTPSALSRRLRLGYQSAYQRYSPVIGDTVIYPIQSGRIGVTRLHYNLDLTDDPVLPMHGMSATFRGEWWDSNTGTNKPFPVTELRTHFLFPLNHEILRLSGCVRRLDAGLRKYRDPAIFSGGWTASSLPLARMS